MARQTTRPKTPAARVLVLGETAASQLADLLSGLNSQIALEPIDTFASVQDADTTDAPIVIPVPPARAALREKLREGMPPGDAIKAYMAETRTLLETTRALQSNVIIVDADMLKSADPRLCDALAQHLNILAEPRRALAPTKAPTPDRMDLLAWSLLAASPDAICLAGEIEALHTGPVSPREMTLQNVETTLADWQKPAAVPQDTPSHATASQDAATLENLISERNLLRAQTEDLLGEVEKREAALDALRQEAATAESLLAERNLLRVQTARLLDGTDEIQRAFAALTISEKTNVAQSALLRENTLLLANHLSQQLCRQQSDLIAREAEHRNRAAERQSLLDRLATAEAEARAQTQAAAALRDVVALLEQNNTQLAAHLDQVPAASSSHVSAPAQILQGASPLPAGSES